MIKNKVLLHQIVLIAVLAILVLWRLVAGTVLFDISLLWWLLGAVIGFLFVFFDKAIFSIFDKPEVVSNTTMKEFLAPTSLNENLKDLFAEKHDQKQLPMRSFLFVVVWMILGFFTVTSVTNFFARGLILGIGTHLVFDLVYDFFEDKERLDAWFWQIKRTLEPEEKRWFVIFVGVVYFLLGIGL